MHWRIQDFPGGGHKLSRAKGQPIMLQNFCGKLHENERNCTEVARVPNTP